MNIKNNLLKFFLLIFLPLVVFGEIHFSLPDTLYPSIGEEITLPITIDNLVVSDDVKSYKIIIGYDSEKFSYSKGDYSKTGTISNDLFIIDNVGTENQITFAAAGSSVLSGSGVLLNFTLTVLDNGVNDITINEVDLSNSPATYTTSDAVIIVNTKPVFEQSLPDTSIEENETLNFNYEGFDGDGDDLTYILVSEIDGMTLSSTGQLNWTPTYEQSGSYEVIVSISDGFATVNDTANVTVVNKNQVPIFESMLPDTSINELDSLSYEYSAVDGDGDIIFYNILEAPADAQLSDDGIFSWKPGIEESGTYLIVIEADDGVNSTKDSATVIVNDTYRVPVFDTVLSDTIINEGETLSFQYVATDVDEDELTYQSVTIPDGVSFSEDGLLTWTPTYTQSGVYELILAVTDGYFTVNDTVQITVENVNSAPDFTTILNDTTIVEGQNLVFQYEAIDVDEDTVKFSLLSTVDGMTISEEGLLTWMPTYDQEGDYEVIVGITDGIVTVTDTAKVVVTGENRVPVFSNVLPDTSIDENQNLTFEYTAEDPDGDVLTFSLSSTIEGMTISESGTLVWTPSFSQAGTYELIVVVNDGVSTANDTSLVTVNDVNQQPNAFSLLEPVNETALIINADNIEDSLTFSWEESTDLDGDAVTYSIIFYNEVDTLIAETGLSNNSVAYPLIMIYELMQTNEIEEVAGMWTVWASDSKSGTPANEIFNLTFQKGEVGIDNNEITITDYHLFQNYPNPFNPTTTISYSIPLKSNVKLSIYNMLGKDVNTLVNGIKSEGSYTLKWNAADLPSGIYVLSIHASSMDNSRNFSTTRKMMLLK